MVKCLALWEYYSLLPSPGNGGDWHLPNGGCCWRLGSFLLGQAPRSRWTVPDFVSDRNPIHKPNRHKWLLRFGSWPSDSDKWSCFTPCQPCPVATASFPHCQCVCLFSSRLKKQRCVNSRVKGQRRRLLGNAKPCRLVRVTYFWNWLRQELHQGGISLWGCKPEIKCGIRRTWESYVGLYYWGLLFNSKNNNSSNLWVLMVCKALGEDYIM